MTDAPLTGDQELEIRDWLDSFDEVVAREGREAAGRLLERLRERARGGGVSLPEALTTPYVNTIPPEAEPPYPGDRALERRIKSVVRWNAMAMVVRANRESSGIGGHISTYASAATLYEVGFNHFFRAGSESREGDLVYFQGHAAPGIYARAFVEGRLSRESLENFRRELKPGGGLASYPHPWLMPGFWQFPTVSMGLGPLMAIYQARFNRYLEDRGLKRPSDSKVWAFLGDGETDEPEALGAVSLAGRERLDNLIFVVNCNLQRLDGPVRGNGQIVQELEAVFRGAGWNVIKVLWGGDYDPLFAADREGVLRRALDGLLDGELQKFSVESGGDIRRRFFGRDPRLLRLAERLSDDQLRRLRRGGHDPQKVHAAYRAAAAHKGRPTVILAGTIKGYGLGESGEGRNVTHQQKKLNEAELREFRTRFDIPLSDDQVAAMPFFRFPDDSPEARYLREVRAALGGPVPRRRPKGPGMPEPSEEVFAEFLKGTSAREVSTTMALVRLLSKLLKDPAVGRRVVPIVPDEARTFGMEPLFRQCGIYSHVGQLYEPVDSEQLVYYREARDGQILEEGITEAGSTASLIAAGTSYSTHGLPMIPFFLFYSMFGLQRAGDLVWAAGDMRCRGFMAGGTAGRTTLAGEGLQHQDGNSHLLALPVPNLRAYDPAFAYEVAVIVRDGIRRMCREEEGAFVYLTVGNENYPQPPMPEGCEEGILRGLYLFRACPDPGGRPRAQLLASGAILNKALEAQTLLLERFGVPADVWSATSWKELYRDAREAERWSILHPDRPRRASYAERCLQDAPGVLVAATDYVKALPACVGAYLPRKLWTLGTDGFGRSETREALRDFFEVDARHIALAALTALAREGAVGADVARRAVEELGIEADRPDPAGV